MSGKYRYMHIQASTHTHTSARTHPQDVGALVYFAVTASTSGFDLTPLTDVSVTESLQQLFLWQHVLCMLLFIDTDGTGCSNDIDLGTLLRFL